jgi:hypothetical protein
MHSDDHSDTPNSDMDDQREVHEKPREEQHDEPREELIPSATPDTHAADWDNIAEASYDSFPASDAPGWSRGS